MFRAVFPSIIRRSGLYIQQSSICQTDAADCLLGSSQQYLFGCCMYSLDLLMMDGKTVRNMQSVFQKQNKLRYWCILLVLLQKEIIRAIHVHTGLDSLLKVREVKVRIQSFQTVRHVSNKVVSPKHRPYLSPRDVPGTHLCQRLSRMPRTHRESNSRPSGLQRTCLNQLRQRLFVFQIHKNIHEYFAETRFLSLQVNSKTFTLKFPASLFQPITVVLYSTLVNKSTCWTHIRTE